MPTFTTAWTTLAKESGATTILNSSHDTKLLCVQRFVRLFAYGISFLILVHYLANLGINDARIGLFMTLTLLGDVVISFCLTLVTDKVGRRDVLAAGAGLMAMSGVVFALSSNYWVLVLASVVGVISPRFGSAEPQACALMATDVLAVAMRLALFEQSRSRFWRSLHQRTIAAMCLPGIRCLARWELHLGR